MFGGGVINPYDDIVNKTTDENLTSENWELILNLCDKVQDEGQEGAHSVIAAVLKRLAHRNPNVQLYALSLAEALSKNCTVELHREIASRAFTQGLEKIITDRTTHEKVRRRALGLIAMWTAEFEHDSTLGIMEDCYNNLKAKNYKFEAPEETPPPTVDDEIRRKEEEELQRVLEMSMQDKGGRNQWQGYSAASSSGAGGSGSSSNLARNATASASSSKASPAAGSSSTNAYARPTYQSGYAPARTPSPRATTPKAVATVSHITQSTSSTPAPSAAPTSSTGAIVTRVRALHTFEPTEPGELAFEKGDVIKVVDRGYKDWWRGQLKGRTGIFPVNYVEAMPEPTAAELAKEAEQEAAVFAQAVNVEKLLNMLRSLDPAKDNLADNEEIQELYRSSMALRPKIVKLIDKYSQKRADLVSMNETFVRARTIFDRMMEESLARHTGIYEQSSYRPSQYPRPDSRSRARQEYATPAPGPQPYGWNGYDQSGYSNTPAQFPAAATATYPEGYQVPQQPYVDPNAYAGGYAQPYPAQQPGVYGPQGPTPYPAQAQAQPQPHQQPQSQPQPQPQTTQPEPVPAVQTQVVAAPAVGPPYTYDPNTTYADPNVQAWAQYYAQGGKDPAGAVYFISIPGITDGAPVPAPAASSMSQQSQQQPHEQPPQTGPSQPAYEGYQVTVAGTQQTTPSELAGYAGPQPQVQPATQPVNGYFAGAPTSAYPSNTASAAAPWVQQAAPKSSSPPTSPVHNQGPISASFAAPGSPTQQQVQSPIQQQPQQPLPYGSPGANAGLPPANDSQYYALNNQFAGMAVGDAQSPHAQSPHPGQGLGAPA